jgi:hypothetical protein
MRKTRSFAAIATAALILAGIAEEATRRIGKAALKQSVYF